MAIKLDYQPNPHASSLRRNSSKMLAVVIPEVANNFFALAINGIEYVAQEKGYHVLIYITHENKTKEVEFINHLQNGRVDGVLMSLSAETDNFDHLVRLKERGFPLVFFDRVCESIGGSAIVTDDFESGFAATEHLIKAGCTRIAYLDLSRHLSISSRRMDGYKKALEKHGLPAGDELVRVHLVAGVPDEAVLGEVEGQVQGEAEFDDAEVTGEVGGPRGHDPDEFVADLLRERLQLLVRELVQVRRGLDLR